jgi:hypothetical protein
MYIYTLSLAPDRMKRNSFFSNNPLLTFLRRRGYGDEVVEWQSSNKQAVLIFANVYRAPRWVCLRNDLIP